jgi:predicted glycosyltransferase
MYDYEHTETTIFNRFSDRVLVPERIPDVVLDSIGLTPGKRVKYPGIKEELYLRGFQPSDGFLAELCGSLGIAGSEKKTIAVLRPPATTANYHSIESEKLLDSILKRLTRDEGVFTFIVPRTSEQASEIKALLGSIPADGACYHILATAVNGLELAFAADLLISGGGTMNREAGLLGVAVYSIFAGKLGSLDAQMEADGIIRFVRTPADVEKIELKKRVRPANAENGLTDAVESFVIRQIDAFLD